MNVTNKTRKVNHQSEWITISDAHEPIISSNVFEQVQKLLEQKAKRGRGGTRKLKNLFTNFAYCSDCGKSMHYRINRKGYICGSYAKHGKTTEMLLRFVEKIEVNENKDVKIYYKFAQVEGL